MRERFVEVDRLQLCLCEWGPSDGPPILCLHGWMHHAGVWHDVAELLAARGCRVIGLDLRGYGRSQHVGPGGYYHFADYFRDVDGVVRLLAGPPLMLVGHSMGGSVASMYAGLRPAALSALVLIEGLGPPAVPDDQAISQMVQHLDELADPPERGRIADLDNAVARLHRGLPEISADTARRLTERVVEPHPEGGLRWTWDPLHRTRSPYAFDRDRYLVLLGRITAPVTAVWGEHGYTFDDLAVREAAVRNLRRVLLPSGHNPHMECPAVLAELLWSALGLPQAD